MENKNVNRLTQCAMIAALAYVGFQFLRIDIPVGTERTAIHLGNTMVVLGALLLGSWGGFAGALGLTIADLTSGYVTTAPQTFVLKMIIGLITVLVSRKIFHLDSETDLRSQTRIALFSSMAALGANVILDPLVGYFYKTYIFGIPRTFPPRLQGSVRSRHWSTPSRPRSRSRSCGLPCTGPSPEPAAWPENISGTSEGRTRP